MDAARSEYKAGRYHDYFVVKYLFLHQAFPGQYKHIVRALGASGHHDITFVTESRRPMSIPGVNRVTINVPPPPKLAAGVGYAGVYQALTHRAEAYYKVLRDLISQQGLSPDVISAHLGGGIEQFVRDAFPTTPMLTYQEFFPKPDRDHHVYPARKFDAMQSKARRIFGSHILSQLVWSDWHITPTRWQRDQFPPDFHGRFSVLHDGIDTGELDPALFPVKALTLPGGKVIPPETKLVTYIARNLDTVRGFPQAIKAINILLKQRDDCECIVVGGDGTGYGDPAPEGTTWREHMARELDLDLSRIHFTGQVSYPDFKNILAASDAHIYLTTEFVLSWSLLEAMAMACAIVGSATPPVMEVIRDNHNGLHADFNDPEEIAEKLNNLLENEELQQSLGRAARQTISARYAKKDVLPLQLSLLNDLAEGKVPPPTAKVIKSRNAEIFHNLGRP